MTEPLKLPHLLVLGLVLLLLQGCAPPNSQAASPELVQQAELEATALIQQAKATALLLQAQAEATAMVASAARPAATAFPPENLQIPAATGLPEQTTAEQTPPPGALPTPEAASGLVQAVAWTPVASSPDGLQIINVSFGAEGAYIVINYTSPPDIAQTFWPGVLSVTDEATSRVYNEVPVMPIIGPLIARPRETGLPGYFMLVNGPQPLPPGSLVTVVMAEHQFEHIPVQ